MFYSELRTIKLASKKNWQIYMSHDRFLSADKSHCSYDISFIQKQ